MGDQPRHPAASHVPTPRLVFGNPGTRLFPDFQELRQMTLRLSCASRRPSATPAGNHNGNPGLHFLSPLDSKVSPRCYQLGPDPTRVIQGGLIERKQFAFVNTYVTKRWSWGVFMLQTPGTKITKILCRLNVAFPQQHRACQSNSRKNQMLSLPYPVECMLKS